MDASLHIESRGVGANILINVKNRGSVIGSENARLFISGFFSNVSFGWPVLDNEDAVSESQ